MGDIARYLTKLVTIPLLVALFVVGCDGESLSLRQQLALAGADPTHLLSIYASLIGIMFVMMLVFGGRGVWWALIDAICGVSLLSLATCPIYWVASGHWKVALAIGLSGLLALAGTITLYWRYQKMPEKKPLFPENEDGE